MTRAILDKGININEKNNKAAYHILEQKIYIVLTICVSFCIHVCICTYVYVYVAESKRQTEIDSKSKNDRPKDKPECLKIQSKTNYDSFLIVMQR